MRLDLLAVTLAALSLASAGLLEEQEQDNKSNISYNKKKAEKHVAQPKEHPVMMAGAAAQKACEALATTFASSLSINNTFSIYYPEGSNPSLERLTATYPAGTIPDSVADQVPDILADVGPDIDITKDFGYGQCRGRAAKNGPLGGLPAFCRFGAFISTSPLTNVLAEVWLPLTSDPKLPLAKVDMSDYPTNSTPVVLGRNNEYIKKPTWIDEALKAAAKPKAADDDAAATNGTSSAPPASSKPKAAASSSESQTSKDTMGSAANDASAVPNAKDASADSTSGSAAQGAAVAPTKRANKQSILRGDQLFGSSEGWNGRLCFLANGGQRGFVPLTDMKQFMCRYGFAVSGSNSGHFSTTGGVTWVNGTQREETLKDFGSRSSHITKILSDELIDAFYGKTAGVRVQKAGKSKVRSYMAGCSVGGGRSLASTQVYPDDFDGLVAGAPSISFNLLNQGQIHTQKLFRRGDAGPGRFNLTTLGGPVHEVILKQCDKLDGVEDGVIGRPDLCKPRFEDDLLCGKPGAKFGGSNATCLTPRQITNLEELYKPTIINGTFIYPAYLPGIEQRVNGFTGLASKAIGWTLLASGLFASLPNATAFDGYNNITLEMIEAGERDIGGVNAQNPDISAFINRGGKLISYHGLADAVISPVRTSQYYDEVVKVVTPKLKGKKVSDSYRHFEIPGMSHCRDGPGPWCFGSSTQNDAGNRPLKYDTKHDMILALVAWAERGTAPDAQVGVSYVPRSVTFPRRLGTTGNVTEASLVPFVFRSYEYGIINTRILCPYPSVAAYKGGATQGENAHLSFACKSK